MMVLVGSSAYAGTGQEPPRDLKADCYGGCFKKTLVGPSAAEPKTTEALVLRDGSVESKEIGAAK